MPRTRTLEASRRRRDDARAWGFSHQKRAALLPKNSRGAREGGGTRRASAGRETAIGSVARCRYRSDPLAEAPHTAANGRAAGQWPPRSPERADRRCERGTVEIFMRRVPRIIRETSATSTHPSRKRRASGHPRFQPRTNFLIDQITHQKITRKWRWKDRSVGRSVGSFFEKSFFARFAAVQILGGPDSRATRGQGGSSPRSYPVVTKSRRAPSPRLALHRRPLSVVVHPVPRRRRVVMPVPSPRRPV